MKRMKRLVALLVVITTIASLCVFSIPASAEETATVSVSDEDILRIEKLEALGVIDASYDPATYVTRRKMADIIVKYMNITTSANTNGTPFRDVTMKDSSFASICTLYNMGIITGDDELRFNPDNYVTYDEALVFIINAIGHKMFAEREGGYPTGYHRVAIKHNMLKGLSMQKGTDPVHFPDLYKMLESALDAATVIPQYYGDGSVTYTLSSTDTYLYEVYGIRKYHGIVTGNENTKLTTADSHLTDEQIEIDGQLYDTPGYVYDYFLGYAVDYYVKINSETDALMVYIEEARNYNEVVKVDAEDILPAKTTGSRIYYTDEENTEKEYHINFDTNYDVIYNKQCWTGYGMLSNVLPVNGYIEALDNNNDGAYDVLFVYEYRNVVVQSANSYDESVTDVITGDVINIDSVDNEVKIHYVGETKKRAFSSITKDSVLSILMSKGTDKVITVYIATAVVNGKIVGYDSTMGWQIGEDWYEPAYNYYDAVAGGTDLAIGIEGDFYLDMNGDIVMYKFAASKNDESALGVVAGIQPSDSRFNPEIVLKVFTRAGAFEEMTLSSKVKIDGIRYDLEKESGAYNATAAITALRGVASGDSYALSEAYLIKYTTASGLITSIDTGARGGVGNINAIVKDETARFLGRGQMVILKYSGTTRDDDIYTRFDNSTGVIFMIPSDDKVSEEELYSISNYKFSGDRYHGPGQSYLECDSYSAYSFGATEIPVVDAFVCKTGSGEVTKPTADSMLALVTEVSTSSDADGISVPRIYYNDGESINLAMEVTVWDSTRTAEKISAETLINNSEIKEGTLLLCATDIDGNVDRITFIADYDSVNGLQTRANFTAYSGHAMGNIGEDTSSGVTANVCFGEIVKNDAASKLLQVKLGGNSNIVFPSTGNIYIYVAERNRLVPAKVADIAVGDQFIARLKKYFELDTLILFR